jgi:ribosomal protein L7/L12
MSLFTDSRIDALVDRVDRLTRQVAMLADQLGIDLEELEPAASGEVALLVQRGKKIEAIKAYRDATGAGLKEAKDAVEAMERELRGT